MRTSVELKQVNNSEIRLNYSCPQYGALPRRGKKDGREKEREVSRSVCCSPNGTLEQQVGTVRLSS